MIKIRRSFITGKTEVQSTEPKDDRNYAVIITDKENLLAVVGPCSKEFADGTAGDLKKQYIGHVVVMRSDPPEGFLKGERYP
jgi:hypothetical protein